MAATTLRDDALAMAAASIGSADAGRLVAQAMVSLADAIAAARHWHVVAAGKASGPMLRACLSAAHTAPVAGMAVAPGGLEALPQVIRVYAGGHPVPTQASLDAGRCALDIVAGAGADDLVVVLVSGGASALLVQPIEGVSLQDKQATSDRLLRAGADIHALNVVRKHLSMVKGGRLAAATRARVVGLAVSDVVGDDPSVIGSGLTAGDPSTFKDALGVLERHGGTHTFPASVVAALHDGVAGRRAESPAPGTPALNGAETRIIGSRRDAMAGARAEAERLGYHAVVIDEPVVGEARAAARTYVATLRDLSAASAAPLCVVSSGETTVRVFGGGRGGRNQEFALALVNPLSTIEGAIVVSVGTDGIDGPTDAAGAIVSSDTLARARALHLNPQAFLDDNDAYHFFDALADLIKTGPTRTNVGDIQIALVAPGTGPVHL